MDNYLKTEDGSYLLQEMGDKIILEEFKIQLPQDLKRVIVLIRGKK